MSLVQFVLKHYESDYRAERHTKTTFAIIAFSFLLVIFALILASKDYTDVYFQKATVTYSEKNSQTVEFPITSNWSRRLSANLPVVLSDNSGQRHSLIIDKLNVDSGKLIAQVNCRDCQFTVGQNTDVRVIAGKSSLINTFIDGLR